ncbi:hypothetical protein CBER1_08873 [Cercospora berteroae]|uniref:Uncharacterized protein n=1 Tax=Cercospora berteroae TaxID=357750 RepID=A0A2S6CIF8_9PEZI|nr:hypothetical protein CBER1_08873 [Cercospora berteroae]
MPTTRSSKRVAKTLPSPAKHISLAARKRASNTQLPSQSKKTTASPTRVDQVQLTNNTRLSPHSPDRPSSHPYLNTPDLNRTTSGLFLTDRDVRLPSPRTHPMDSGSLCSRPGSRPASPIARAPSPLRHEILLRDGEGEQNMKPGDIEIVHLEIGDDGHFDMVISLRDSEELDVKTRNVPMMFLDVLTKQLDEWGVVWVKN